jgi:hypothetical protein
VGTWSFTWTGRESALTAGPRTGTATYTRVGTSSVVEARIEGKSEAAGAYQETATLTWQEAQKAVTLQERLSMGGGITLVSTGDWSTPIAIHLESAPVVVKGQSLRLRRTIGIVSALSFTVNEELSTDGGPFVRLGGGVFKKAP